MRVEPGVDFLSGLAAGVLATVLGVTLHEAAHALAGSYFGGDVVYLSSTGVEGRWSTFRNAGWFFLATSGTAAQAALALVGWLAFRRAMQGVVAGASAGVHAVALLGWATFVVNAWMPAMYLIASPTFAFGDWMHLLDLFAALGPMRVSAAVTGLFVAGLLWKASGETLARLVGGGKPADRTGRAADATRAVWVGCGLVAGLAGVLSPVGPLQGLAIALGSTLGSTWPILFATRKVGERPVPGPPLAVGRHPLLIGTAALAAALFIGVLGPGIRFD